MSRPLRPPMPDLLCRPQGDSGHVHRITPGVAGWTYVGFDLWRLGPGDRAAAAPPDRETILVVVEGRAHLTAGGQDFGLRGDRMTVFDRTPPHAIYVPPGAGWTARAEGAAVIAACTAPATGRYPVADLGPDGITLTPRGKGTNTRFINNIAMEGRDVAESLLVTEVFTPAGHWSSYPSHRHDEDRFPEITLLEETYYMRLNPAQGFGVQRVYTEDGSLDVTMAVADGDVTLVPRGHHPCAAPYGYDMYYLNVMAGPRRNWRFLPDPATAWIMERDG
jgi:5-deoxy-glucuronate isomerase